MSYVEKIEQPEYLYHYTNVNTLALILKNRTIRFRSLDQMDDLQEQQTADLKNIGKFCFISSWTAETEESIPMWNMYATLNAGVRIRLCTNPFKKQLITDDLSEQIVRRGQYVGNYSVIPVEDMVSKRFFSKEAITGDILRIVNYTEDKDLLYPQIVSTKKDEMKMFLNKLGVHKNEYWRFQNEWRYIFKTIPVKSTPWLKTDLYDTWREMAEDGAIQPFTYYDILIDDEAFNNMQITLSPKISTENREMVFLLKEQYNNSVEIIESKLLDLI